MSGALARALLPVLLVIVLCVPACAGERILVGPDIPARLSIESAYIFQNSDSVFIDSRLLPHDSACHFENGRGYFDLSRLTVPDGDTLIVRYNPVPVWLKTWYGRPLPELVGSRKPGGPPTSIETGAAAPRAAGDITLSGAKTFRFYTTGGGNSQFSQSLDLNLSGELTPGLEIKGSVSDRGYDPTYGTSNSRLSELDKVNLTLRSRRFSAQVGDIITPAATTNDAPGKSVSGAAMKVEFPTWYVDGVAARPKGRFETATFLGQDGFQGPYQVTTGSGARPVVPGSESVWLDGRQLERGAGKDYVMDYPTGRITFTARRPIDSRSRIEIDFEPRDSDYKGELFSTGGGVRTRDSSFYVSVSALREGDDRNQPLAGELSSSDRQLLAEAGDSAAYRSGVTPDTTGNYVLSEPSPGDSVYVYVGESLGDYRVQFTYLGAAVGSYQFLGGERYQFVGAGAGDYAPVVRLPAAVRTDYYRTTLGSHNRWGDFDFDLRQSSYDANLWSSRDDGNNDARYYQAAWRKEWGESDAVNSVALSRRVRELGFRSRERLDQVDFKRAYLLPEKFVVASDETLNEFAAAVNPTAVLRVQPTLGWLDYKHQFEARKAGLVTSWRIVRNTDVTAEWQQTSAELTDSASTRDGSAHTARTSVDSRLTPWWRAAVAYEHDRRTDSYTGAERGARYDEAILSQEIWHERLSYEWYLEDSLHSEWSESLRRHRVSAGSSRRLGRINLDLTSTVQWLRTPDHDERAWLARSSADYVSTPQRLTVNTAYTISEERRNARGISYLEVEPGLGNYIYEDGQYLPDPNGNYIQVEEILSETARVRRAEKSFYLSKDWSWLSWRFDSDIEEELKGGGRRTLWWALPFYADDTQPYLFLSRRYNGQARMFPIGGFYAVNLEAAENLEKRELTGSVPSSRSRTGRLTLRQIIQQSYLSQSIELFSTKRASYYSGSGDVNGYELAAGIRQVVAWGELSAEGLYRRANGEQDERSSVYAVDLGSRVRLFRRGELRTETELYRQQYDGTGVASYLLTGNRPGERGATWSLAFNYGVKGDLRITASLNGRHSDDRIGRVTGRGEVVAGF